MTTLEKIKVEIEQFKNRIAELPNMADSYCAVDFCLQIIDKYAEQEPKTGHWNKSCRCSECGEWQILESEKLSGKYKFCPNCGAYMEGDKE